MLWVHGCCFNCPGCIAESFRKGRYKEEGSADLAEWVLRAGTGGLTISGGEPMLQAAALADMIGLIRRKRAVSIVVYTGFLLETLEDMANEDEGIRRMLEYTDILIDGPYMQELDDGAPYIGSANQRLLVLNKEMETAAHEYYLGTVGRRIELQLGREAVYLIGVPSADQRAVWEKIKKLGGNSHGQD